MSDFKIELSEPNIITLIDVSIDRELSFTSRDIDEVIEMLIQASEKVN